MSDLLRCMVALTGFAVLGSMALINNASANVSMSNAACQQIGGTNGGCQGCMIRVDPDRKCNGGNRCFSYHCTGAQTGCSCVFVQGGGPCDGQFNSIMGSCDMCSKS